MQDEVKISKDNALRSYNKANKEGKELLSELLKGQVDFNQKITDRVKTFEDACAIKGITPSSLFNSNDTKDEIAYKKLKIIVEVLNEGWIPNWNNTNEYKWYPYFDMRAGFGFSDTHFVFWTTCTAVGSRLCFKSKELAEYAGKQFQNLYKDLLSL